MAKQLMIYERAVPISVEAHKDVSVKAGGTYGFAREVNSVPVLMAEFAACATEYAIVFAGNDEVVFPSVILGMRGSENAMVNEDGAWKGRYVPAFLRRYPFVFASAEDGQSFALCIDEEFEGVNREGKGERLFDSEGNRTRYLEDVLKFTSEYQGQFNRTEAFCKTLKELELLEPAQAQFTLPDGERAQMGGFKTVNREKLRGLPADTLADMMGRDELEMCFLQLQSLNNLSPFAQKVSDASS